MPAIVIGTEDSRPAAEIFAYATDPSSKRSITRPSLALGGRRAERARQASAAELVSVEGATVLERSPER